MARGILGVYTIVAIAPALLYGFYIVYLLRAHRDDLLWYYSDLTGKRLDWLKVSVVYLIAFAMGYTLLRYGPFPAGSTFLAVFGAIANTVAIYYISLHGLRQFALSDHRSPAAEEAAPPAETPEPPTESDPPELFAQVERAVREERLYLDPQLTVATLGAHLGVSARTISRVVNEGSDQHFNGYINRYRVAEAKRLLGDPEYDHYSMEGIAAECGFNAKATFYQAFKQFSDASPSTFRRQRSDSTPYG